MVYIRLILDNASSTFMVSSEYIMIIGFSETIKEYYQYFEATQ